MKHLVEIPQSKEGRRELAAKYAQQDIEVIRKNLSEEEVQELKEVGGVDLYLKSKYEDAFKRRQDQLEALV